MSYAHTFSVSIPPTKLSRVPTLHVIEVNLLSLIQSLTHLTVTQTKAFINSPKQFRYAVYIDNTHTTVYEGCVSQKDILLLLTFAYPAERPTCFIKYTIGLPGTDSSYQGHFFCPSPELRSSNKIKMRMTHDTSVGLGYEAPDSDGFGVEDSDASESDAGSDAADSAAADADTDAADSDAVDYDADPDADPDAANTTTVSDACTDTNTTICDLLTNTRKKCYITSGAT
jgi:hypothetical protein